MAEFTNQQTDKYLESGGMNCPYCDGDNLDNSNHETLSEVERYTVTCADCGARWYDVHGLVAIEPISPPVEMRPVAEVKEMLDSLREQLSRFADDCRNAIGAGADEGVLERMHRNRETDECRLWALEWVLKQREVI